MPDVRPGLGVEFFYYNDYEKENIHAMRSVVYEQAGKRILLAQSSPAVLQSGIKRAIVVTYVVKKDGQPARLGFPAKIVDIIDNYRISSGARVHAVVIEPTGETKPFNVRFSFRVRVPSSSAMRMRIGGERVNLIDISLGGAMVSVRSSMGLRPRGRIKAMIAFDDGTFEAEAEVLRVWRPTAERNPQNLDFAALKFINPSTALERALGGAILTLERQRLADDGMEGRRY